MKRQLAFVLALAANAAAQSQLAVPTFELERLTPNGTGDFSVALTAGDALRRGALRGALLGHYESDPLV